MGGSGALGTGGAGGIDVARTTPATRTEQTIAQVKNVLRRLRASGNAGRAAPLFIFDAGYSAAALTDGLLGCPPASSSGCPPAASSTPAPSPGPGRTAAPGTKARRSTA